MMDNSKIHNTSPLIRFITCGSVDDGKSTLLGRLLHESKLLFDDEFNTLGEDSQRYGTQGDEIDFALLVDGLSSERSQGITIDIAYRYFSLGKTRFIAADTPGHEQYTRNMATAASTADFALVLVDATKGLLKQTRRHTYILSLLGVESLALVVNKMDRIGYRQNVFVDITSKFTQFTDKLKFTNVSSIPLSALKNDNVVSNSKKMPWYQGPHLSQYLQNIPITDKIKKDGFAMPVQLVNRPNSSFRGYSGTIRMGTLKKRDPVRILPSNNEAFIEKVVTFDGELESAQAGSAVTVTLDRQIDVSQGDVITTNVTDIESADQCEATLIWMDSDTGYSGRSYRFKSDTTDTFANITKIKNHIDLNTMGKLSATQFNLNDIGEVTIKTDAPFTFTPYSIDKTMGSFILVDRYTNATAAAGIIKFPLRRGHNITPHKTDIDRFDRRKLHGHKSCLIWLTGLSGSGKSTIANKLETYLHTEGISTFILDGDNVRKGINQDLGFTDADRIENIRRLGEISRLMVDAGIVVIVAAISPFESDRHMVRSLFDDGDFYEVFVKVSLTVATQRDPKGLYKKALRGEIPNFTGIGSRYEEPTDPDLILDTQTLSPDNCVEMIMDKIEL